MDRGTFNGLANRDTAPRLKQILSAPQTAIYLKIAVLEALATANSDSGLTDQLETYVLAPEDNSWLRSTALKALAKATGGNAAYLEMLDGRLSSSNPDSAAAELRATLLTVLPPSGDVPARILSILDQASDPAIGMRATGYLYPLLSVPTDDQLDFLLDGSQAIVSRKGPRKYEIRHLFSDWFIRRLNLPRPISPEQLARWLKSLFVERSSRNDLLVAAVKASCEGTSALPNSLMTPDNSQRTFATERDQWLFIVSDIWEMLPPPLWPDTQAEFFLQKVRNEPNAEYAANFFRLFLQSLPGSGANLDLTEFAHVVVETRTDLASALGDWTVHEIEPWRISNRWKEKADHADMKAKNRAANIAKQLIPHLHEIRAGTHHALGWGTNVFFLATVTMPMPLYPEIAF